MPDKCEMFPMIPDAQQREPFYRCCRGEGKADCEFMIWDGIDSPTYCTRGNARPHTPAPEPDHKAPICENCGLNSETCRMDMAGCLQAQNEAARAATLKENMRVLDAIEAFANATSRLIDLNGETGDESEDMVDTEELKHLIKSLRTAQEHP